MNDEWCGPHAKKQSGEGVEMEIIHLNTKCFLCSILQWDEPLHWWILMFRKAKDLFYQYYAQELGYVAEAQDRSLQDTYYEFVQKATHSVGMTVRAIESQAGEFIIDTVENTETVRFYKKELTEWKLYLWQNKEKMALESGLSLPSCQCGNSFYFITDFTLLSFYLNNATDKEFRISQQIGSSDYKYVLYYMQLLSVYLQVLFTCCNFESLGLQRLMGLTCRLFSKSSSFLEKYSC